MGSKLVKGFFAIAVEGYYDTQYGHSDYPSVWCVGVKRYCNSSNTDKIRKFDSYEDAQEYIDKINPKYKKNRNHTIMYVTVGKRRTGYYPGVTSTRDGIDIDLRQAAEDKARAKSLQALLKAFPASKKKPLKIKVKE